MDVEEVEVLITVGDEDITGDVIWAETSFQVVGSAQPGSCTIALRGLKAFMPGRDLIALYINDQKMWWGYLFVIDKGYVFPDSPQPKMTLHGVDLNILFDKLVLYNRNNPEKYPAGGEPGPAGTAVAWPGRHFALAVTVTADGVSVWQVTVPGDTSDVLYIQQMLNDFDLDLISPKIKWGQPPDPPNDMRMVSVGSVNGSSGVWTPPSSGTTLRAFFTDVARNVMRSLPGSSIWYIDPEGYINWRSQDTETAAFTVGDGPGAVMCRDLVITNDISSLKNDVLIFTGRVDPTKGTQDYLYYAHEKNEASINQFGRFQWSEVMGSDWMQGMIQARATKILTQEGIPSIRATFTVFKSGLYPGQLIKIFSGVHTFTTFDPTFGLQTRNEVLLPIRAVDMTFKTQHTVEYRVTCSIDTNDPWGLLMALRRAPVRGLVQPNFAVVSRKIGGEYITTSGMIISKEFPERLGNSLQGVVWQCTYAYVPGSMTVVAIPALTNAKGVRMTTVPEPTSGIQGFLETDPDNGKFKTGLDTEGKSLIGPDDKLYVEYTVWHNLDRNAQ